MTNKKVAEALIKLSKTIMGEVKDEKEIEPVGSKPVRTRLTKASSKVAYGNSVEDFIKLLKSGGYKYLAAFPGRTRPGKRPKYSQEIKMSPDKMEEMIRKVVVTPVKLTLVDEGLIYTFLGTAGRKDTYAFTMVPYEQAFASKGAVAPKKKVSQIAEEIKAKLLKMGMSNLGQRHAKAGDQFGLRDSARRIAVGRTYLMLNYLYVEQRGGSRRQGSRWSMHEDYLLSKITDKHLEAAVRWVKRGPTMKEVRGRVRDMAEETPEDDHAMATGLRN